MTFLPPPLMCKFPPLLIFNVLKYISCLLDISSFKFQSGSVEKTLKDMFMTEKKKGCLWDQSRPICASACVGLCVYLWVIGTRTAEFKSRGSQHKDQY